MWRPKSPARQVPPRASSANSPENGRLTAAGARQWICYPEPWQDAGLATVTSKGGAMENELEKDAGQTRRSFVKTAAYVAPAILTLKAMPAFAQNGSNGNNGGGNGCDPQPPGTPPENDTEGCPGT